MADPTDFALADLATTMMREVFRAIQDTAMEQTDAFSELCAKASLPEGDYVAELAGATADARAALAKKHVQEVVLPLLSLPSSPLPDPLLVGDAGREALLAMFAGLSIDVAAAGLPPEPRLAEELIVPSGKDAFPWMMQTAHLLAFAEEKLVTMARDSHRKLRMAVKSGLPRVLVNGGEICAKVTMTTSESASSSQLSAAAASASKSAAAPDLAASATLAPSTGLRVRVANERSAAFSRSQELVGSVKIDFRVGSFPPVDFA